MADQTSADMLINLESMIKTHISAISRLQEELKKHREMLDDIFTNDPTYQEHDKKAKEASKVKQSTRQEILKRPQVATLSEKVKGFRNELKETKDALSDYLREFQRMSGVNEIEDEGGELHEIVFVAKLVKRGSRP